MHYSGFLRRCAQAYLIAALFAHAAAVAAFEPVTAIDDGFSMPIFSGGVETSLHMPGA